ncbi:MAG TPA: AAA family ATPase, partial [Candidatus Sulfomarinibacteraceae bacterium]|nr:AAA family ATPase [Candidatus Sulfomarinibacteraceae bacterium]
MSDNTLTHAVAELRNALGDDARTPSFIETIHRRGYRLITAVEATGPEDRATGTVARFPVSKTLADGARNPYPGLAAFTESDAELFFGREAEVAALWRKLTTRRLLAVIGPSGVGKSSLLRAGLIPVAPEGWGVLICQPGEAPFSALARALSPAFSDDPEALAALFELATNDTGFAVISKWRQRHDQALVIVDQFEELFTQNPPEVQARFAEVLGRLARETDAHVLLAMRDDFVYRCHAHEALKPVFDALTPISQPAPEALARALALPAKRCGYAFDDDDLVGRMVAEVAEERAALPLLAFTAARLWEERDRENRLLTLESYQRIGGIHGALAGHAEATVASIGAGRLPVVREIFRNLVTAEGTRATREVDDLLSVFEGERVKKLESEKVRRSALPSVAGKTLGVRRLPSHSEQSERSLPHSSPARAAAAEVLRELIDARLLTSYEVATEDGGARRTVEIVHESLLAAWPRLVRWQAQDAEGALLRDQLRQAARTWHEHGRSDDLLWSGSAYREYAVWRDRYPGGLTELEEAFATAMTSLSTRRRRRRRIAAAAALAFAVVVAAVFGTLWQRSVQETRRAEAEAAQREAAHLLALGRLKLADSPNAALAFAIASLELADNEPARHFAVEALAQGPPVFFVKEPVAPWSLAWSPNGRWIALGSIWGIALLDRDSDERRVLTSASGGPYGFTSDSRRLLTGLTGAAQSRTVEVWTLPEGKLERSFGLPENGSAWLVGDRLLTLTGDPPGPERERTETASLLSLDGTTQQVLGIWRPRTSRRASSGNSGRFRGPVGAQPDRTGTALAWIEEGRVFEQRLDSLLASPRVLGIHKGEVAISEDPWRDRVVTGDSGGEVRIWNVASASLERVLKSPADARGIALDPGGRFLATSPQDRYLPQRSMYLFDLAASREAEPMPLLESDLNIINHTLFSPDGAWLASVHGQMALLWNMTGSHPVILGRGERPVVTFADDGHLLSGSTTGVLRRWSLDPDAAQGVEELWSRPGADIGSLSVDPTGQFVAMGDMDARKVMVVPLDGPNPRSIKPDRFPGSDLMATQPVWDPSGRFLAFPVYSWGRPEVNGIGVVDLITGTERTLDSHADAGEGCEEIGSQTEGYGAPVWLRDGRLLSDGDAGLRVWDLETGTSRQLRPCSGFQLAIRLLATSDSRTVVRFDFMEQTGDPTPIFLTDLASGRTRDITWHGERVGSFALDPSGKILVTGDKNGVVRAGPLTGGEPHLLFGHSGPVTSVAVSPNGRLIASGSNDGTIRLWSMPDLSKPPLHTLPHDELLAKLKT